MLLPHNNFNARNWFAGLIAGPVLFFVGLGIVLFLGLPMLKHAKRSAQWPKTTGEIVSSQVVTQAKSSGTMYSTEVTYQYTVDGQELTCSQVRPEGGQMWRSSPSAAKEIVARYPAGKQVEVYYDPELPVQAVLEPGTNWFSYAPLLLGVVFMLIGGLGFATVLLKLLLAGALVAGALAFFGRKTPSRDSAMPSLPPGKPPKPIDDDAFDIS